MTGPDPLFAELEALAVDAATRAGTLLTDGLARRATDGIGVATKSTATDLVTEFDTASEALLVELLLGARPDDGLVGEEGTDRPSRSGVRWVVDPLDGTTNYFYGHPGYGVSVAAEVDGIGVVAGAVADPAHSTVHSAALGLGARCNGKEVRLGPAPELAHALVATGFSYEPSRRERQARVLVSVLPRVRDIRRMGAAAVDLCSVAVGRVDAFYERGLQPWDYAAGALIAAEAGARVGDLDGGATSAAFTLATHRGLFEPLADLLRAAGAGEA